MDNWRSAFRNIIRHDATRAAYDVLAQLESHGLRASSNSGHVKAVRLHDDAGGYFFSYIINAHHLLFYIRKPALAVAPHLAAAAARQLNGTTTNNAGETTVRIETAADAQALCAWLIGQLPLR